MYVLQGIKDVLKCNLAIIGGGNAGLVAAIEAAELGANVLLLEKAPRSSRGGNSRLSGGRFRFAYENGNEECKRLLGDLRQGIEIESYTKDQFYNDLMRTTEGLADKYWAEVVVDKSLETMFWLRERGVQWDLNVGNAVKVGKGLFWPSGTTVLMSWNEGEGLVENLYRTVEARGVKVVYEICAQSLEMDADGRVCGLVAKNKEGMLQVEAKNVILSCGGFEGNPETRRRYLGEGWDLVKLRGTRYNTGDGLRMAMDIGAQPLGHWGGCHASVVSADSPMIEAEAKGPIRYSYPYSIMVNIKGERFIDEGENFIVYTYAKTGKQIMKQPEALAFQIFDSKVIPLLRPEYQAAEMAESNSLEDLAEQAGIDPKGLAKTVREFNESIKEGVPFDQRKRDGRRTSGLQPDKTNWAQKIDKPPFRAYAVVCGITFTYGGLKTNEKAQVIDVADRPIGGLYAIGEMQGGLFYHNYPSGAGLMKGAIVARIAINDALAADSG